MLGDTVSADIHNWVRLRRHGRQSEKGGLCLGEVLSFILLLNRGRGDFGGRRQRGTNQARHEFYRLRALGHVHCFGSLVYPGKSSKITMSHHCPFRLLSVAAVGDQSLPRQQQCFVEMHFKQGLSEGQNSMWAFKGKCGVR